MTTMTYRDFDSEKILGFSVADAADVREAITTPELRSQVIGFRRPIYDRHCEDVLVTPMGLALLSERFGFAPATGEAPKFVEEPKARREVVEDLGPDEGEFGIGTLHMTAAVAEPRAARPIRGETMVCPCCHRTFERRLRMATSRGTVCPDCYDRWSE